MEKETHWLLPLLQLAAACSPILCKALMEKSQPKPREILAEFPYSFSSSFSNEWTLLFIEWRARFPSHFLKLFWIIFEFGIVTESGFWGLREMNVNNFSSFCYFQFSFLLFCFNNIIITYYNTISFSIFFCNFSFYLSFILFLFLFYFFSYYLKLTLFYSFSNSFLLTKLNSFFYFFSFSH